MRDIYAKYRNIFPQKEISIKYSYSGGQVKIKMREKRDVYMF